MGSESTGFKQAPGDVVGEVPEVQGGAAEVLEAPVDRFGWAVAGAGAVVGVHPTRQMCRRRGAHLDVQR